MTPAARATLDSAAGQALARAPGGCDNRPMQAIDTVVFDIGRVLVHLEFSRLLKFLSGHGVDVEHVGTLLERMDLTAYERGDFDGDALLQRIAALGRRPMTTDDIRRHWVDVFIPQPPMLALLRALAGTHRVYLLSNIGDLHWEHLDRELGVETLGHGALPSFRARAVKPQPAIYRHAEQLFGLDPARTVLVDDLQPNVEGARRCGWHAILHESHERTADALAALGVHAGGRGS